MRKRRESGRVRKSRYSFAREGFGWFVATKDEIGIGDGFFGRHVPSVEGIDETNERETNSDDSSVFANIFEELMEAPGCFCCISRLGFVLCECVDEREESKNGEEEHGGKLGEFRETESETGQSNIFPTRMFEKAYEEVKGEKEERRNTYVGRDIVSVRDHVGIKCEESNSDDAS